MLLKQGLVFFCFVILLFQNLNAQNKNQRPVEKTAFYTIKATYDSVKNKTTYVVKSINVIDKATKPQSNIRHEQTPDYLKITVIDKSKHASSIITEHPLRKHVELFSESGEIESKSISLQQGEVIFKIPYYTPFKKIKITEVRNFKKTKTVIVKHEK